MEMIDPTRNRHPDLVIAAPHEGYDLKTEEIARDVGRQLEASVAVARNYRKPKLGRFFNVNRPTESDLADPTSKSGERVTGAATEVFDRWIALVQRGSGKRVPFYVEIHGFKDSIDVKGEPVTVEVAELATVDVTPVEAKKLQATWAKRAQELCLPPLYVDQLDPDFQFAGQKVPFQKSASSAKSTGVLQSIYVGKALHFELPPGVRGSATLRHLAAQLIAEVVEPLLTPPKKGGA
jgi:hypothetical protein